MLTKGVGSVPWRPGEREDTLRSSLRIPAGLALPTFEVAAIRPADGFVQKGCFAASALPIGK